MHAVFKSKSFLYSPLAAVLTVLIWCVPTFLNVPVFRGRTATVEMIRLTDNLIQNHVREWGDTPKNFSEIRLYARQRGLTYSAYDAWGERFEYLRLGKVNYLVRSFGSDGVQNSLRGPGDIGAYHWGYMVAKGLRYDDENGAMHPRPSVVLFAGADDASSKWHAKLFVDSLTGVRRLLVRSRERANFFMLAPHDAVEEFLWVPGQAKIVFTASQSARYSDGLYVWDLAKDEASNLFALDPESTDLDPGSKQRRLYLALSSVRNSNPPTVAVFAAAADEVMLNPNRFFEPSNLHIYSLGSTVVHTKPKSDFLEKSSLYDVGFLGTETLVAGGEGSPLQKAWLRLPLGGDWEKGVSAWQDFASTYGKSQLTPYAVWGVAMFYQEAAKRAGPSSRTGQIFNSYSVELGTAMSKMIVAPGYVRGIGAWFRAQS